MRATISPDGTVELADGSPDEIVAAIMGLKGQVVIPQKAATAKRRGRPPVNEDVSGLTSSQAETWQYLISHDSSAGTLPETLANHFQISPQAARLRMTTLAKKRLAHFTTQGGCRPGPGEDD